MGVAWLYLIPALFAQEAVTLGAALFQAQRAGISPLLINLAWLVITAVDISLGFMLGRAVQRRFRSARLERAAERFAARINTLIGKNGRRVVLTALGFVMFPYVNAFFFSWIDVPFFEVFAFIFLGDALYWSFEWAVTLGLGTVAGRSLETIYIIVLVLAVLSVVGNIAMRRYWRRQERSGRE